MVDLTIARPVPIRDGRLRNEVWLHERIAANPEILGLGSGLAVRDRERIQPRAGRLDLLLADSETQTRYEVEVQLGAADETHIIRTIEYWDIERQRFPAYDHFPVLVAEDVTSRFLNVVRLLNGSIPIYAVQLNAYEVDQKLTLIGTVVVRPMPLGTEEEDESEPADRAYWERKASASSLTLMDQLTEVVQEVEPEVSPSFRRHYIGFNRGGIPRNFVVFIPRQQHVIVELKLPMTDERSERLDDAGIARLTYNAYYGNYRLRVTPADFERVRLPLREAFADAYGAHRGD